MMKYIIIIIIIIQKTHIIYLNNHSFGYEISLTSDS
jgi:hypothetical protein